MKAPDTPIDEELRLKKLQYYKVLDTLPEQVYDDLVRLAGHICGTPIALVSLVDNDRQWFKAKHGLDADETPRDISFCGHAINSNELFEVSNALEDERFADNPLVTGGPEIRFYAGAPLITPDNFKIGTLCVINPEVQKLTQEQREHLEALSRLVVNQLEIRVQNTLLEAALKVKDRIMSTVTHELRNPLNGIMGITQILTDSRKYPQIQHELKTIYECGNHLLEIINDILELNKINMDKIVLNETPLNIREEIKNCLKLIQTSFRHKSLESSILFSDKVPNFILSDGLRLKQVIYNLLGNAFKFTDSGSVTVNIDAQEQQDKLLVMISVTDTGIGIDEGEIENIFNEFVQESSSIAQNYGGSGLGLSIANKLAKKMNGNLVVQSKKGVGSTFLFTFETSETEEVPREKIAENVFNRTMGYTALVVDDNELNLKVIKRMLKRLGFKEIVLAESGKEAIEKIKSQEFDIVFMDVFMPEMDGLEATAEILKIRPSTQVIGLSANSSEIYGDRATEVGMRKYIEKPIQKQALIDVLKDVFE